MPVPRRGELLLRGVLAAGTAPDAPRRQPGHREGGRALPRQTPQQRDVERLVHDGAGRARRLERRHRRARRERRHALGGTAADAAQAGRDVDEGALAREEALGEIGDEVRLVQLRERARAALAPERLRARHAARQRAEAAAIGGENGIEDERLVRRRDAQRRESLEELDGCEARVDLAVGRVGTAADVRDVQRSIAGERANVARRRQRRRDERDDVRCGILRDRAEPTDDERTDAVHRRRRPLRIGEMMQRLVREQLVAPARRDRAPVSSLETGVRKLYGRRRPRSKHGVRAQDDYRGRRAGGHGTVG
jgi:hypothetical protein